ncbi:MAG: ADP-ribosylglycohydrolase family protein [Candidatus Lokiarchaeota archaeon]|nr:ADP-ribosylglycohydrolase family protein [Candidatus Lokiarchaeota archaeon]
MKELTTQEYYNKVFGSWIGRVAGDFVGAPLELKPVKIIERRYGQITYYPKKINLNQVNDDEMYEIIALITLEEKGLDLTAKDIALGWLDLLKYERAVFTAEKSALNNLKSDIFPPESGSFNNPYFDFIGAQMRADIWGQITPGCPQMAKKYAQMDGSISHAGIGIEGEIFIAVLISNAFFEKDINKNINQALINLPKENESTYTKTVKEAIKIHKQYPNDFRKARSALIDEYWANLKEVLIKKASNKDTERVKILKSQESEVHVLPNIGIIILSLLYGAKDKEDPLGKSICVAGMMGYDTDCNCGNIGAILGVQLGEKNIPLKWKEPLQDTFSTYVINHEKWKISELARRVADIGEKFVKEKCSDVIKIISHKF